ncbi:hypothetical protein [Synechococcus elongatus]|uniref:hypothetical protein n=1 Tax=Synechococcus elongatus TaxID=32046 RepID=UPI0030CF8C21
MARDRQLDLDLHVDESLEPSDRTLQQVAAAVQRKGFTGKCSAAIAANLVGATRG